MLAALPVSAADWSALEHYQQTITRNDFEQLVTNLYSPSGALINYLSYNTNSVTIFSTPEKTNALFSLRFARATSPRSPVTFKRIALDPGHIGGQWARMEERFFVRGKDHPIQEAVLNLTVARLLRVRLETAGAEVFLTKNDFEPVTEKRPEDFHVQAERELAAFARFGALPALEREAGKADAIRKRAELLFYRNAEIAARARFLNEKIKPDITLCIHFNAVEWNECQNLVDDNRLVVFMHGNYLSSELKDDDQKLRLLSKLLEGSHSMELRFAEALASALAKATGLPPVQYAPAGNAIRLGDNPYVYARNLAANRLVDGPVVFIEPYYMNNRLVYQRLQLGDYDGVREIEGRQYRSIFREYADAVADGLIGLSNSNHK
jgi:hypothetical protein